MINEKVRRTKVTIAKWKNKWHRKISDKRVPTGHVHPKPHASLFRGAAWG